MKLESSNFAQGQTIPLFHSKMKKNQNPALGWSDIPEGTQELVLLVENPEGSDGIMTHWLVYGIPPEINGLPMNIERSDTLPLFGEAMHGFNDYGQFGWDGPLPSLNQMCYIFFRLFALNEKLDLRPGLIRMEVVEAMEGKVIEVAELIGTFSDEDMLGQKNPYQWGMIS